MSKFTKGKWVVRGREVGVIDTSDTQSYGMMNVICYLDEYDFKEDVTHNAKLIAAAPEMYNTLNTIYHVLCGNTEYNPSEIDTDTLRELIDKAGG